MRGASRAVCALALSIAGGLFLGGCATSPAEPSGPASGARDGGSRDGAARAPATVVPPPAAPPARAASARQPVARTIDDDPAIDAERAAARLSLALEAAPLATVLMEIARGTGLQLAADAGALDELTATIRVENITLGDLLRHLEAIFPLRFRCMGRVLRVDAGEGPRMALLMYSLPAGLVSAELPEEFESLRKLSFISRSQREEGDGGGGGDQGYAAGDARPEPPSHLERFLEHMGELLPWPDGSAWHLDKNRNLLLIRSAPETLAQARACLDEIAREPVVVEIETRFLEVSEGRLWDLGVELGLAEDFPLDLEDGEPKTVIGDESATRFGIPALVPGEASGLTLSVLGVMTQPRFTAILHALATDEDAEMLSAPAVATLNNSRATIAITRNLPFVEDYRPVFDRNVVASEGIASSDANVALVASINDRNFTGIVLNVTPSVGTDSEHIHMRIQPVVRDQVDSIVISNGALVEGVSTPAIARPIIETRLIDTQLGLRSGSTLVLGGLKRSERRRETTGVPFLSSIPLLGRLFRRDVDVEDRRDLIIFVTARVLDPAAP